MRREYHQKDRYRWRQRRSRAEVTWVLGTVPGKQMTRFSKMHRSLWTSCLLHQTLVKTRAQSKLKIFIISVPDITLPTPLYGVNTDDRAWFNTFCIRLTALPPSHISTSPFSESSESHQFSSFSFLMYDKNVFYALHSLFTCNTLGCVSARI